MITEELLDFIRTQHAAQMSVAQIKHLLLTEGEWSDADINEALQTLEIQSTPNTPEADDFLGIFLPNEITEKPPETHDKKTVVIPPPAPPLVVTPVITRAEPTPPPSHVFPLTPSSPPSTAKFDLSMFRKNVSPSSSSGVLDNALQSMVHPSQKTIKTQSVMEAGREGKEADSSGLPKIKSPVTWAGKIPLASMRTMSSDILFQQKGKVTIDASAPPEMPHRAREVVNEAKQEETMSSVMPEIPPLPDREAHKNLFADISPFHKNVSADSPPNVLDNMLQGMVHNAPKTVNTRSIAEMWLQDVEESVQGLTETKDPKTHEEKTLAVGKRDTSGDLLLRGKGKVIPGVPALFVPPTSVKEVFREGGQEENLKKKSNEYHEGGGEGAHEVKNEEPTNTPHLVLSGTPSQSKSGAKENPFAGIISTAPVEIIAHTDKRGAPHEFIEALIEKKITKDVLPFIAGALILTLFVIGLLYAVLKLRGPNIAALLANASQQFYDSSSFAYQGGGTTDFVLSTATDGLPEHGKIKFSLDYKGLLENGSDGYGDGMHHVTFIGGITSGDFTWETNIDADVVVVGQTLYFHVLSLPEGINADPELFKTYWVALDLSEVAKELALDGLKTGLDEYGGFAREHLTFNEALEKSFPFTVDKRLADEMQDGAMSQRFRLKSDPDRMAELIRTLYHAYTNKELALNVNQELRFKNALEKIGGDVWINAKTGALVKFAFAGDLDDDMLGVHVKGPLSFAFAFSDFNKSVTVNKPSPILTLEETRVRMDDYKVVMEKRMRDTPHIDTLHVIEKALADYYEERGRYPTILSELIATKVINTTIVSTSTLKTYFYMPYVNSTILMNSTRCTASGKACAYYHLGVNLEDVDHPALAGDADITSGIRGKDTSGCGTEKGFACFDVVAPTNSTSTSP